MAEIRRRRVSVDHSSLPHSSVSRFSSTSTSPIDSILRYIRIKLPAIISLFIGVLVGVLVASSLSGGVSSEDASRWSSSFSSTSNWVAHSSAHHKFASTLPTLDQRFRVFEILATLTGYHTRQCTRFSQRPYRQQVYERYEPLVGYDRKRNKKGLSYYLHLPGVSKRGLFGTSYGEEQRHEQEVDRIFNSKDRDRNDRNRALARQGGYEDHKYFFAINLYNSFDIIPDLFSNMFKVSSILGFQNVFVSVYENGSTDQTKALLRLFDALARSVGLRVVIRTSLRTRGAFHHRIEYLAEVRNAALAPLHELREAEGEVFDSVIFMNDVLPCVDDLLELVWQSRRQNAGITCGSDYIFHEEIGQPVFYDNWVARDMNGTALENAPFEAVFRHPTSSHRFQRHLPIQVQSCWNGIAVLDSAPIYAHPHVKFRMAKLSEGECSASECSLICNDYWQAGYGRIIMISRVKLAYDKRVFDIIHPERRNLTLVRGYQRLGGHPDDPNSDPQDRSWYGPHDRLFRQEESEELDWLKQPSHVWCWGWDGAGDIAGPDVEPIWEPFPNATMDPLTVRHDRSFEL